MSKAHLRAKLRSELAAEIRAERFDVTTGGIYFPRQGIRASGDYFGSVNNGAWEKDGSNLVPDEGIANVLNIALGTQAKATGFYLAIFSGSAAPQPNWTAASFTAVANEIISQTEGHTSPTRPVWTPANVATGTKAIDNLATVAQLQIATSSQLTVTGAAMLTSSQRGGVTGALISASLYDAPRQFQNGDIYRLGYRFTLED